jgi:hypothetical protein
VDDINVATSPFMLTNRNGLINWLNAYREKRRLRRSLAAPFIAGVGRDSFRYYEAGRSLEINAELMLGDIERRIYRKDLKWNDSGELLSATKQAEIMSKLCEYFDRHRIRWEFYGT